MIVYWSIFIYTTLVSYFCVFVNRNRSYAGINSNEEMYSRVGIIGALVSLALLIYFAGMRTYIADTSSYISSFTKEARTLSDIPGMFFSDEKGILFSVFKVFFKNCISSNFQYWLMFIAIFQGFAIAHFYSKYSTDFNFSCYLFIASGSFVWMINGMRQFIAVCIILLAMKFLFNRKIVPFFIFVFIAMLFHSTAIMWFVFYFVVHGKPFNKKVIISICVAIVCVVFVDQFTDLLEFGLKETNYSEATKQFSEDDGVNPVTTLLYAIPVIIAFWKRKVIMSMDPPRYIQVLINMSCITVAISLVGNFTSGILIGRLPIYFSLANFVLLPWLIKYCFLDKDKIFVKACCYIGYFCYFLYYMYIANNGMRYMSTFISV